MLAKLVMAGKGITADDPQALADIGGNTGAMIVGARDIAGELAGQGLPVYAYRFSWPNRSRPRARSTPATFRSSSTRKPSSTAPRPHRATMRWAP
jgi:hypothetical protein